MVSFRRYWGGFAKVEDGVTETIWAFEILYVADKNLPAALSTYPAPRILVPWGKMASGRAVSWEPFTLSVPLFMDPY